MLKKNPTRAYLKKKVKGYADQGDLETARRFIETYAPLIPDVKLDELELILKPKPKKIIKEEKEGSEE